MSNVHALQQVRPYRCQGCILRVHTSFIDAVEHLLTSLHGRYHSYFAAPNDRVAILNLHAADTIMPVLPGAYVVLQSGSKMRCGYEAFIAHMRHLAPFVADAAFYVADEEDYLDQFVLRDGQLHYQRGLEGASWNLDAYLAQEGFAPLAEPDGYA